MTASDFILSQFSIAGRTSQKAFLRRWLKLCYGSSVLLVVCVFLISQGFQLAGYVAAALILLTIIANYSMIIRRFHDRNRSGWWLVACLGLNIGSSFLGKLEHTHQNLFLIFALVLLVANLWLLIELFFRRGSLGTNRFGEDPANLSMALGQ
jgi:uncharacterized membrane protein YhaH (DUF805 family)